MIISLAFVPILQLDEAFSTLLDDFPTEFEEQLLEVAGWFETYYLGRMLGGQRRKPLFPPEIW